MFVFKIGDSRGNVKIGLLPQIFCNESGHCFGGRVGWLEKGGEGRGNSTFFTSQDTRAVSNS